MTAVMLAGSANSALPLGLYKERSMSSMDVESARRRRTRVKSVESAEMSQRYSLEGMMGDLDACSRRRLFMSQSVDYGQQLRKGLRNRGSTEMSDFEGSFDHCQVGEVKSAQEKGESESEYDSEAVDTFEELNSYGSGIDHSVYTNASSLRSIQSNSEYKTRFSFLRKSSYISRSSRPAAGGLAKLLRRSDLTNEEKVDSEAGMREEDTDVLEQERHFGFMKCIHCLQIYACERGNDAEEEAGILEDYKRSKYCSGECHLTHLSSLYEKQRKR